MSPARVITPELRAKVAEIEAAPARRKVPEWIGATPDTPIPPRVKLRIWERERGRCYLTDRKILAGEPFDYEHVKSIRNGGENRESNIRLALRDKHREKTAAEATEGAKADRIHLKHIGQYPKSPTPLRSRNSFQKREVGKGQPSAEGASTFKGLKS